MKKNVYGAVRTGYPMDHMVFQNGMIGGLQMLDCVPTLPGDSISYEMDARFNLAPLNKPMTLAGIVDLMISWTPMRHIYSNWTSFITQGADEAITLGTNTSTAALNCMAFPVAASQVCPKWLTDPYMMFWKAYMADPMDATSAALANNYLTTLAATDVRTLYGMNCCFHPRIWNSTIVDTLTTADTRFALTDANTTVDLYSLSQQRARLKSEVVAETFGNRYRDKISAMNGGVRVDIDADQRPRLCAHTSHYLDGTDVNFTDAANTGKYRGKGVSRGSINMPAKYFPEHGILNVFAVVRFPPIVHGTTTAGASLARETHYLARKSEPTYAEISGDYAIAKNYPPVAVNATDLFNGATSATLGKMPQYQYYREHPNIIGADFTTEAPGQFPFYHSSMGSRTLATYIDPTNYQLCFNGAYLKHWNMQANVKMFAKRFLPDPKASIFAGTD